MLPSSPTLDHVAIVVPDLDQARTAFERLGFQLTAKSSHQGPLQPGDAPTVWGGGNHCAMFQAGYLEILGVTDPTRPHQYVLDRLVRGPGWCLLALRCRDAIATHKALRRHVAGVQPEVTELGRSVRAGHSQTTARFRFVHLEDGVFPETDLFFIEHPTPEVLWQPQLLAHDNGTRALSAAVLVSTEPADTMHRLQSITGLRSEPPRNGVYRLPLDQGCIEAMRPDLFAKMFATESVPSQGLAAVRFSVSDLEATSRLLAANAVATRWIDAGSVAVAPAFGCGAIVLFEADPMRQSLRISGSP